MEEEKTKLYLDENGFRTKDGEFVSLRDASNLGVESVGNRHRVQVYSTKTHKMHVLDGDSYSSEDAAQSVIDAHNRSITSAFFENNEAPVSVREAERYAEHKVKREAEMAEENRLRSASGSIYLD